jgi:hypothetical protein
VYEGYRQLNMSHYAGPPLLWQNQPYPLQTGGVHQPYRRSLLETVTEFPPPKRQDLICVVVHLKRESASKPWGLAFSKFDDRIVLGRVQDNGRQIDWCHNIHCRDHLLDSRIVFSPMFVPLEPPEVYPERLKAHVSRMATLDARHQQLWPGDLLLSIDGFDPRYYQSLTGFTNYIRTVNRFTCVVLRNPVAATTAIEQQDPTKPNQPYVAAASADLTWRLLFPATPMANVTYPAHNSNIMRRVTPDRSMGGTSTVEPGGFGPRSLFGPHRTQPQSVATSTENPLDLLSRVAGSSAASSHSFQAARDASTSYLKKPPPSSVSPAKKTVNANTLRIPSNWRNPWFKDANGENLPFDDNFEFSPEDGQRAKLFLPPVEDFPAWLAARKMGWKKTANASTTWRIPSNWRNPWFKDAKGENLPFEDNLEFSPEDGQRAKLFLPPVEDFPAWLTSRKKRWRQTYKLYKYDSEKDSKDALEIEERTVAHDFWTPQGFTSFENWMIPSLTKWKRSYSWNRKKTRRIQEECEAIVHVSQAPHRFQHWLRIRRNQWRLLRRKRQRQRNELGCMSGNMDSSPALETGIEISQGGSREDPDGNSRKRRKLQAPTLTDMAAIDVILEQEDQERKRRKSEKRRLVDIAFLFDASLGAPDDIVVLCFSFLDRSEYNKLLCINKAFADALKAREEVWRQLCPTHWILPRRPRKPWHELYFHRFRIEQRDSKKLWDDLLVKCSGVLVKGDHLQKIEKLVQKAEKDFGFDVNYVSGVVCERNSILNLAVIHQRHKVVRWLVDKKRADVESYDRGHFRALHNAAWSGDRQLVRLLLQRGADRTKIAYGHYSKALAHPDFKGLTAEGWARKRGHDEIADLIRLGL